MAPGSRSVQHVKTITDKKLQNYDMMRSPGGDNSQADEEMAAMRRKLHNHILKNQYSYWAGMYVKRLPGGGAAYTSAGRPSEEEVLIANKST